MKMGTIAPIEANEQSLRFRASVLTITPPKHPDATTLSTPACLCGCLSERSVQTGKLVPLELLSLVTLTLTYEQRP